MRVTVMHPGSGIWDPGSRIRGVFLVQFESTSAPHGQLSYLLHGVKDLSPPIPDLLLSFLLEKNQRTLCEHFRRKQ